MVAGLRRNNRIRLVFRRADMLDHTAYSQDHKLCRIRRHHSNRRKGCSRNCGSPLNTSKSSVKTYDSGKYKYYTLKSGESLWTVSKKTGISFARLQELNKGLDPKRMQPGDKIKIAIL